MPDVESCHSQRRIKGETKWFSHHNRLLRLLVAMSSTEKLSVEDKMGERGEHKSKLVGVSLLVLSVLLTASVSVLIYMAVVNGHAARQGEQAKKPTEVDVEATVNVKTADNRKVEEKVYYNKGQHVAYYHHSDGSFDMDDFNKGLHITKADDGICYVSPVSYNGTNDESVVSNFIENFNGGEIEGDDVEVNAKILDGWIKDTSFFPERAHQECKNGFRWLVITPKEESKEGTEVDTVNQNRNKRALCYRLIRCYIFRYYVGGRVYYLRRCIYYYYNC